ncbi:MAG: 2-amino-4-hydroxy-6-hydroxymethyldihydropteridine diphosphokinase [Pseudomonadota bacterium]
MSRIPAFVALGANLGDALATVRAAARALHDIPDSRVLAVSSLYRTAPVGVKNQPDFINAVALLETDLGAHALLDRLFAIERQFGRRRDYPQAPRTLDLDLLLYGSLVHADPRLTLPHPRMHQRAFVLVPLLEIAPEAVIPGLGPAAELARACGDQKVERLG